MPASANRPLTAFPRSYASLPALSFVIPNLNHDMHDGSVASGDSWLRSHLGGYVTWARTHNSLLVVTWDEDDYSEANRILTIVAGAHVRATRYTARTDHYGLLRTLEALFGLPGIGAARVPRPGHRHLDEVTPCAAGSSTSPRRSGPARCAAPSGTYPSRGPARSGCG